MYLNFALPLLMLGLSSLIRLLAIDIQGEFIWFLDFNLSIIGLLGGTLLLVLWKKGNQHQKEILDTIQERINNSA